MEQRYGKADRVWVMDRGMVSVDNLEWLETLNALRVEGKIDKIGVSIRDYRPDEGVDIAALGLVDSIQVIFNLFEQGDGSSTRRYEGTGLGLALSQRLVELMGGSIVLESQPGSGSVFDFSVRLGKTGDPAA